MELQYFGTELSNSGHHLWEVDIHGLHRSLLELYKLPFNPEGLPYKEKFQPYRNGWVQYYDFCGFTICAIEGSCHDTRPGSKSIFFVKGHISKEEIKAIILSKAKKIIDKMPFEIKW